MRSNHRDKLFFLGILCGTILLSQMFDATVASAASDGYDDILSGFNTVNGGAADTGLTTLQETLGNFGKGFTKIASIISVIMTATAAMMVAFGVEDGKKSVWSWILGIGLAIQAAPIFNAAFGGLSGMDMNVHPVIPADVTSFHFTVTNGSSAANKANPDYWNVTGNFMNYYIKGIIYPAAARIVPYACRICLVLTCIDVSVQLGLKLVEGDKVKFMVSKFLTCGIYLFLITNWVGYGNDMGIVNSFV